MSKAIKHLITEEYKKTYADVDNACVVSVVGLDGTSSNALRGRLNEKALSLRVVKNSLARRAFAASPLGPLADALDGPCALVVGGDSAIDAAKLLVTLKKDYPKLELKLGMLGGDPELIEVEQLAKMMGRDELLAELAMLIGSPGRSLAGALAGPGGRIAGCLKARADEQENAS